MKSIGTFNRELHDAIESKFCGRKWVPGYGRSCASLVLVGEAPGAHEEEQGRPFVGAAGKYLTDFLNYADISRDDLYITNVVKIRPFKLSPKTNKPVNRPPNSAELVFFTPFLKQELQIKSPRLVVSLGNVPLKALLPEKGVSIGKNHGRLIQGAEFLLFPLYHPAAVIYNASLKDVYIKDLEILKEVIKKYNF